MKFGLENIGRLCDALGHPERAVPSVIVAGTNGKGSVTAMVRRRFARRPDAGALHLAASRTHRGAFVIDGANRATADLEGGGRGGQATVERLAGRRRRSRHCRPSSSARPRSPSSCSARAVDVAVLEVGLGGRLDATNVVMPMAAAITSIDFDHEAQLGETLEAIAREKAGVIKPGVPGRRCGPMPPARDRVIEALGREAVRDASAARAGRVVADASDSTDATIPGVTHDHSARAAARACGRASGANAAVAVCAARPSSRPRRALDPVAARRPDRRALAGTARTCRAGRGRGAARRRRTTPPARALRDYLREIGWTAPTLVLGAMRDKDVAGCWRRSRRSRPLVCTTPPEPARAAAEALAALASRGVARRRPASSRSRIPRGGARACQDAHASSPPDRSFSSVPCVVFFADSAREPPSQRLPAMPTAPTVRMPRRILLVGLVVLGHASAPCLARPPRRAPDAASESAAATSRECSGLRRRHVEGRRGRRSESSC